MLNVRTLFPILCSSILKDTCLNVAMIMVYRKKHVVPHHVLDAARSQALEISTYENKFVKQSELTKFISFISIPILFANFLFLVTINYPDAWSFTWSPVEMSTLNLTK